MSPRRPGLTEAVTPESRTSAGSDVFDVMSTCRAVRRLRPDPVPDAVVRRLVEAAGYAPSGRNLQRARWIVVRDPAQRRRIGELNRRASLDHATAERDAGRELPHHECESRRRMWDAVLWQAEHMHEAPVIVVACCIMDDAEQDPGRYASSVWPGIQNLLLAARASGLGAVPTTYALAFREELEAALELPTHVRTQAVIPIGFPLGRFGPVRRPPVDQVIMFDRWSGESPAP
jgi:nitroreductase